MKPFVRIIAAFILLFLFTSCEKETILTIDQASISIPDTGGSQTITLSANKPWTVNSSQPWCKISPSSGDEATSKKVTINCDANTSYEVRSCVITFTCAELSRQVTVSQDINNGLLVSQNEYNISNAAQQVKIDVQANVQFSVIIDDACKNWVKYNTSKGLTNSTVVLDISQNEAFDGREGKVTIQQTNGNLSATVIIKQGQTDGLFISPTYYNLSCDNQILTVEVDSNIDFEVESSVKWIQYVETKGLKENHIILNVEENNSYDSREGQVVVKQKNGVLSGIITVTQDENYGVLVSQSEYIISNDAQLVEVEVKHNVDFDVIIPNECKTWIEHSNTKSLQSNIYTFSISKNESYYNREGSITFKQKRGNASATVSILQKQTDVIIIEPNSIEIDPLGGLISIDVFANVDYVVSIPSPVEWISIVGAEDPAKDKVKLMVNQNLTNGAKDRSSTITLTGKESNASALLEITQYALKSYEYYSLNYGDLAKTIMSIQGSTAADTISTIIVLGKINANDFSAMNSLPNLKYVDLSQVELEDYIIPYGAFANNYELTCIRFPKETIGIDSDAFKNCINLELIELPVMLQFINPFAFYGCSNMKGELKLPESITSIYSSAFASCLGLSGNLIFPQSTQYIGADAFKSCTGLNGRLVFPTESYCYVGEEAFAGCQNFTGDLIVPNNISLGSYCFNNSGFSGSVYTHVTGWYSFYSCRIGENLIICDDVSNLQNAFRYVKVGGYTYIGKGATSLANQCFSPNDCNTFYIAAVTPPACSGDAINLYGRYLGVPKGRVDVYKMADQWNTAEKIEEADFSKLKIEP